MKPTAGNTKIRRCLSAAARVAGCAGAASLLLAWCWVGDVSAQLESSSFSLGARLARELGDVITAPQAIAVNGQLLWVAAKTTPLSVTEALDRFDAHCVVGTQALRTGLDALASQPPQVVSSQTQAAADRTLIRRSERPERGGQLVCLAPNEPLTSFRDLGRGLRALFATGDLGALGELRYVQARPRAEGGSHVISVWSEGAFNLFDALPRAADVPGDDPERAPRPPDATRVLSASIPGRPYAVRSYVSRRSAEQLLAFYAAEMPKHGWSAIDAEGLVAETATLSDQARAYVQGDALTLVVVDEARGGSEPTRDSSGAEALPATATVVQVGAPGVARSGERPALD